MTSKNKELLLITKDKFRSLTNFELLNCLNEAPDTEPDNSIDQNEENLND